MISTCLKSAEQKNPLLEINGSMLYGYSVDKALAKKINFKFKETSEAAQNIQACIATKSSNTLEHSLIDRIQAPFMFEIDIMSL